jgi:dipeptidyl aminopeptidase/acylaminoacyl peptidase
VRADGDRVVFRGGASDRPTSIVTLDLLSRQSRILKQATDLLDRTELRIADYITKVEPVEFPTTGGKTAFGLFYPPHNPDYAGGADERPPLLVKCHGGPTSSASSTLNFGTQFWTSRGIAVLDVNYGGSTGFGREYRERLKLNWGIVDVDDCVNGAKFLAQQRLVDLRRVVISGGSAGGYTTLAALAWRASSTCPSPWRTWMEPRRRCIFTQTARIEPATQAPESGVRGGVPIPRAVAK